MINGLFSASLARQAAHGAQTAGAAASRAAAEARRQGESVQFDIEKLFMITEALWTFLKHEHGYTDEHLAQMIQEIDLRDGKLDGKVAKSESRPACPSCGRTIIRNQVRCLYCGTEAPQQPFER